MRVTDALDETRQELYRATYHFSPIHSPHEGIGIILEEFEELKGEVFKQFSQRTKEEMRKEAMHVAAMAMRFMVDLT